MSVELRTAATVNQPDVAVNQDTLQTDEVVRSRIVYEEIDSRVPRVRARSDEADYSGLESSTREVRPAPAVYDRLARRHHLELVPTSQSTTTTTAV